MIAILHRSFNNAMGYRYSYRTKFLVRLLEDSKSACNSTVRQQPDCSRTCHSSCCSMQVWVYEQADDAGGPSNLYVHHDILLPAFPLSVAWLDCDPGGRLDPRNLAAVGSMNPGIEIWDLDVADSVEPLASLGGQASGQGPDQEGQENNKAKKKKKKSKVTTLSQASSLSGT